jgi:hypothetical protein
MFICQKRLFSTLTVATIEDISCLHQDNARRRLIKCPKRDPPGENKKQFFHSIIININFRKKEGKYLLFFVQEISLFDLLLQS